MEQVEQWSRWSSGAGGAVVQVCVTFLPLEPVLVADFVVNMVLLPVMRGVGRGKSHGRETSWYL